MSTNLTQSDSRTFLLKVWRDGSGEGRVWRCSLEDPGTRVRQGFEGIGGLASFLSEQYGTDQAEASCPEPPATRMKRSAGAAALVFVAALATWAAFPAAAQVAISVGSASAAPGALVSVPIVVRGVGAGSSRTGPVQALSMKLTLSSAKGVEGVRVRRAGILTKLTPLFEAAPTGRGWAGLLVSFDERSQRILFGTSRKGDLVALLELRLSPDLPAGTTLEVALDPEATLLANGAGTAAFRARDGNLLLQNGKISVSGKPPSSTDSSERAGR